VTETVPRDEANQKNGEIAAFFDWDGTLAPLPSLERRFLRMLRNRHEIPFRNYFLWLCELMWRLPRGIWAVKQTNKLYLKDVLSSPAPATPSIPRDRRLPLPRFFAEAVERVAWHARQGHALVIVSGTLELLAKQAARELQGELATRGLRAKFHVCATRLEQVDGMWTGKIVGEAMVGEAKASAAKKLARERGWDLSQCYAYGDSKNDLALLACVGKPSPVNPTPGLASLAEERGWITLDWKKEKEPMARTPGLGKAQREGSNRVRRHRRGRPEGRKKHSETRNTSLRRHAEPSA